MSERDLVAGVLQLSNLLTRRLAPLFEKARITPQQWGVMTVMASAEEPLTLAGIARRMLVSKQNMTGMIARLEQLGLAERLEDPNDLRSSRARLTRRGRTLVDRFRPIYDRWCAALGGDISENDLQSLSHTVERLITQLAADAN